MKIVWKDMLLPNFGVPEEMPVIPVHLYEERCRKAYAAAKCDWLVVYADREHFANIYYLTGFDPRFEEALFIIGPGDQKYLLTGNESIELTGAAKPKLQAILCQSFSLMGQDRTRSPRLEDILRDIGMRKGQSIGICGWKYVEPNEVEGYSGTFAPEVIVNSLQYTAGDPSAVKDVTWVLMHSEKGLRIYNEAEQIAVNEWAAARSSMAVWRIVQGSRPGISELEAVTHMQYAGEPLSAHVMYGSGKDKIVGLRSPSSRKLAKGDGAFTAVGYWGGLSARGGLIDTENEQFIERWAMPYYRSIATWYQNARIGSIGGKIYEQVSDVLREGGMYPMFNPGHAIGGDEWIHTVFTPGNTGVIQSGMAIQCDIIPAPMPEGIVLNSEDSVVFADQALRDELREKFPEVWARIQARQQFMRDELGLRISDDLLPLSSIPGYYTPLFMSPNKALALV